MRCAAPDRRRNSVHSGGCVWATLEFICRPDDPGADLCVMRGVVPPGVAVPLHSHDDAEDFFILSGTQQVLTRSDQGLQWRDVNAGDYVHIPAGTPHAHRNVSDEPAVELVITTARLGRFFQEVARNGVTRRRSSYDRRPCRTARQEWPDPRGSGPEPALAACQKQL